uniref:Uncharacterized protein n=1 Tax=Schlesneria paludicola TaxID=360056 RepID=A0A7C4QII5_9PLAN
MCCLLLLVRVFMTATPPIPSAEEIVALVQGRAEQVDNLTLEAVWSEYKEGRLVATSRQAIHQDRLGRIRVESEIQQTGLLPSWRDALFNGEVILEAVDDPNLSRMAEPQTEETRRRQERYRHASIYDASVKRVDARSIRNPFTFGMSSIRDMEDVLSAGGTVSVRSADEEADLLEVRFQKLLGIEQLELEHILLVDRAKGWVIVSHKEVLPSGQLARHKELEYVSDPSGLWLPSSGRARSWGVAPDVSKPPLWEWAFRVEKIVVNDPNFDERVFVPSIRPGTYVNDMRHGTSYRVGDEGAIDEQLTLLAQQARAEEAANLQRIDDERKRLEASKSGRRMGSGLRFWLVAINVVVVVAAIVAVWWYRRKTAA